MKKSVKQPKSLGRRTPIDMYLSNPVKTNVSQAGSTTPVQYRGKAMILAK